VGSPSRPDAKVRQALIALPPRVDGWRERGTDEEFRGRRIHLFRRDGGGPLLLFLHGFPSSSYDWRLLLEDETDHAALAPDFLGFGLSEKPRDHNYTLHWQADLVEELVRRHGSEKPVFLVAHDMGTSVATELMARDLDGELEMELAGTLLLNGSMVQGAASPTLAQRLLRSPVGPLVARLSGERFFRRQFGQIFSPGHPLTDEEAEDQWALICTNGGRTLHPKTIRYMEERFRHAGRWHGALGEWPKPLWLAWGMLDPVATPRVLDAVLELRPRAPVTRFEELGHYPQIEDPARVAEALRGALGA
jgi:pimeloyl-ACP methyl ester carboxylesterase